MDDRKFGTRDDRGNWRPDKPLENAPVFVFPPLVVAGGVLASMSLSWLVHFLPTSKGVIIGMAVLSYGFGFAFAFLVCRKVWPRNVKPG